LTAGLLALACGTKSGAADPRATFTPCEGDYECATIEVPVDYANPDGPKLALALLRAPASDPGSRLGSVVVNPGGPGAAFVERLATTYPVLSAGFAEATRRFDVVTFDWRGIGRSAPVSAACADDAALDRLRAVDLTLRSPNAKEATLGARDALFASCAAHGDPRLLAAMNTENAACDLDRIREVFGEEKFNYLGFSYGTWLGAIYATLFPARVRALALDSATVLAVDLETDIAEQARSLEHGFDRFFDACARDAACPLRGAGAAAADPQAVTARLDALLTKLETAGPLPAGGRALSIVDMQFALADSLREADFAKLGAALAAAEGGDASLLLARADAATGRGPDGHYDSSVVGLLAIACLDQPLGSSNTLDAFQAFAETLRATYPHGTRAAMLPWALCTAWPFHRSQARVAINAASAPKALVVSGRYDPITSYDQGTELVGLLANGSYFVTYEGDGHAAALHSACVRDQVTAFLVDPSRPPPKASCPAE
jgi:pimeloyl-ACP methyl ester carboxylesterase